MSKSNIIQLDHIRSYIYLYKNKEYYYLLESLLDYFSKDSPNSILSSYKDILLTRIEAILKDIALYIFTSCHNDNLDRLFSYLSPSHPVDDSIILALRYDISVSRAFMSWYESIVMDNTFGSEDSVVVIPVRGGLKIDQYQYRD